MDIFAQSLTSFVEGPVFFLVHEYVGVYLHTQREGVFLT